MKQATPMVRPLICGAFILSAASAFASPQDNVAVSDDGVPIHYRTQGSGLPALVFVHCWACDQHFWDPQVPRFAKGQQVATLDLAGHGASGRARLDYTIEAFGQDVQAVVAALGVKQVVLIGHSMGGPVILEAARRLGGRVAGLVPVDTLLDVDKPKDSKEIEAFLGSMRADFGGSATKFMRDWMFVPTSDPQLIERIVAQVSTFPPEIGLSALRHTWAYDSARALDAIKVPIHALNADKFPTNLAAERRHAPQFEATIMKGVGHYLMLEDPERFGDLLESTLRAVGPRHPGR
jgi:pimeloyl-ACP methyl ester carboxylesterase